MLEGGERTALSRRQFLRRSGAAVAAVGSGAVLGPLLAACGGPGRSPATTGAVRTSTTSGGPADWSALAATLGPGSRLVTPDDVAYGTDKLLYNERFDDIDPAAIAYCASPADVQRCVDFARRHGLPLAARSGGHSYAGYSLTSGLVVDVTPMASVRPGPGGTATVGAGTRLIDLYAVLGPTGRLVPGGSCPTVGIAGLTLGGGVGVVGRKFGLTCDNVASLEIVTADGVLRTASPTSGSDLYWACRGGGGGNFGIVTSFTFTTHPIPPLALFTLEWPFGAAAEVLDGWLHWTGGTPPELWSNCQLLSASSGNEVKVTGVYCGDPATLSGLLQPLEQAVPAGTTDRFVGPESYLDAMLIEAGCEGSTVAQCHLPSQNPAGTLSRATFAAKSAYLRSPLPSPGVDAVVGAVTDLQAHLPELGGGFVFDAYGGAIGAVAPDATAFAHRDALTGIEYSYSWSPGAPDQLVAGGRQWLDEAQQDLAPSSVGAYVNYMDPTQPDWPQAYYGTNLPRLVQVKRAVDPDDLFSFAQSVPTRLP
ncbi:MAG TPA: FAD-binding oxidoreductase [Acidimicrobiales bacterium]|nr:FAD-binding oxidoreductase [Acidimicrobiales bacterium]